MGGGFFVFLGFPWGWFLLFGGGSLSLLLGLRGGVSCSHCVLTKNGRKGGKARGRIYSVGKD